MALGMPTYKENWHKQRMKEESEQATKNRINKNSSRYRRERANERRDYDNYPSAQAILK